MSLAFLTAALYLSELECYRLRNLAKLPPFVNIILHLKQFHDTFRENYLITLFDRENEMTKSEMTDYYAKRASEYECVYQKPERQKNLKALQTTLSESFRGLDVLEIACGTGYWTQFACRSAKSILATDYNEEVLAIAREKDYGDCPVKFVKADAYVLDEVNGMFSAALVGFWWSHIPKSKLDGFLQVLHSKLSRGATVIVMDNRYVVNSSTPISRTDDESNTYQIRQLSDGSNHEVLKNFSSRQDFIEKITPLSKKCEFNELEYFWIAEYNLN